MQDFSKASQLIDQTKDDSIGAYWRHKKRGAKVLQIASYPEVLHASLITLYTDPHTLSEIQHIYFVYLLNNNSLNPKHLRQTNDRSEIHLSPAFESLNRLTNKSFFVSLR